MFNQNLEILMRRLLVGYTLLVADVYAKIWVMRV